jgi:hypothetical protein
MADPEQQQLAAAVVAALVNKSVKLPIFWPANIAA